VPVRLDRGPIHGLGVFAAAPIAEGAEVWRFAPELDLDLDPASLERQPQHLREYLRTYG
jgi:uncharacterized protein